MLVHQAQQPVSDKIYSYRFVIYSRDGAMFGEKKILSKAIEFMNVLRLHLNRSLAATVNRGYVDVCVTVPTTIGHACNVIYLVFIFYFISFDCHIV